MIEGETIFRSSSDETERRQLFDEYIVELRKTQQEREHQTRKEALEELVSLLKSLDLEPYTRWSEAQAIIRHEHFQSEEKFQALSKLDVLNAFENHIKVLERSFNDKRQKVKNMKMRKERKNREAFSVCPPLKIHDYLLLPCEFANCFFFARGYCHTCVRKVKSMLVPSGNTSTRCSKMMRDTLTCLASRDLHHLIYSGTLWKRLRGTLG